MYAADAKGRPTEVVRFETNTGTAIFLLPVETFPGHINNLYVVLRDGAEFLFDVGSGLHDSNGQIARRFDEIADRFGVRVSPSDLQRVVISHAHIDHFGGAHHFRETVPEFCIHELDARVLSNFEERMVIASKDINVFLRRAGVSAERRAELVGMYGSSKRFFSSLRIERRLRDGMKLPGDIDVIHASGHCPGLICLRVDDILLTSDHVLSRITPNQMPQSITPFTGLENYLRGLEKLSRVQGIRVGLGGHEAPIDDLVKRIGEIADHHRKRLDQCLALASQPRTIREFADELFGDQQGYGRMLAYTEAGAHIEYLHQLGELHIANLEQVADEEHPVIRYASS